MHVHICSPFTRRSVWGIGARHLVMKAMVSSTDAVVGLVLVILADIIDCVGILTKWAGAQLRVCSGRGTSANGMTSCGLIIL